MKQLILNLHKIGAIKFGEFTLKSGLKSPIYIDLRVLASHPRVLRQAANAFGEKLSKLKCDCVAGVPYAALPIATAISLKTGIPMVYARKEVKEYGTKRAVEGVFKSGDRCAVIDDLITTGDSKIENIVPLSNAGLKIKDIIVLIDRQQGGKEFLKEKGYRLHSIFTISWMLRVLLGAEKIDRGRFGEVMKYIRSNK